ncbi:hypothetical protein G6F68_019585 [Rhizopus microsporus]|nr:hypothetical protein G6F68_019585 [Rhizopus microsporus]
MLAGRKRSATVINIGGNAPPARPCKGAEYREGGKRRDGEPPQRKRDGAPRGEGHGADRGGRIHRDEPGALVVADAERATDVGKRHLGDVFVEAGQDDGQQHAGQAGQDARANGR